MIAEFLGLGASDVDRYNLWTMPTIDIDQKTINYFFNNRREPQPALVLIHGAGGRSQSWPYQWQQKYASSGSVRRWVSDYPVYMPDLPGHGSSDGPGFDHIEAYAQFVIQFTEALGLKHVVYAGHSMGGAIAQTIGLMRPANLRGLILLGSGSKMVVNDAILDGLQTEFEKTVRMIAKFSWQKEATPAFVSTSIAHMLATAPRVLYEDFLACSRFDVRDQVGGIDVPVLIVGGSADKMMRLSASEAMAELMPTSQLAVIEAGHFMMYEKTAQTTKALVAFLSQIEPKLPH